MTTSADRAAPRTDEPIALDNDGPNGAGRLLARLPGDSWWFDLSARDAEGAPSWLQKPSYLGDAGGTIDPATFQNGKSDDDPAPFGMGFDMIVWFRTMTPHHRWPVATSAAKP